MSHHEHPNVTAIHMLTEAFNSSDTTAMTDGMADDIEWHEIGASEPIRGKAALAARWAGMAGTGGTFESHEHATVGDDEHVVSLIETTVTMGDKSLTYRTAEIYHMADGKVTARWAFSDDTARINEFFGGM
jgi:ketosteroid isomerase-like protein